MILKSSFEQLFIFLVPVPAYSEVFCMFEFTLQLPIRQLYSALRLFCTIFTERLGFLPRSNLRPLYGECCLGQALNTQRPISGASFL